MLPKAIQNVAVAELKRPDFSSDEWVTEPNVLVFKEHEAQTAAGKPVRFGQRELEMIAATMNRRIQSSGDYPQIAIGHNDDDPSHEKPSVGCGGPFVVGLYRDGDRLRYGIFADLHARRDVGEVFAKYPRRSVELHVPARPDGEPDYANIWLDPICLLGSNAPRLPLGLTVYSSQQGERHVEILRYSCMAPAVAPGPNNVFLPSSGQGKKKYAAVEEPPTEPPNHQHAIAEADMALSEEDIAQLIEKLMQTKPMQFLVDLMAKQEGAHEEPEGEPPAPEHPAQGAPPHPPSAKVGELPAPEKKEDLVKEGTHCYSQAGAADKDLRMKYSQLAAEVERMKAERASEAAKLAQSEAARFAEQKQQTLETLRYGLAFDLDQETKLCEPMDATAFQGHVETLRRYCPKVPAGIDLPLAIDSPQLQRTETSKYSQANVEKAVKLTLKKQAAGSPADYDTILAEVVAGKL